jgi:protein HIRA/HIR1
MNGPVFVGAVIEREHWGSDVSFVGHANTIQVAVSLLSSDRDMNQD